MAGTASRAASPRRARTPRRLPFEEISPWVESPRDLRPALSDDLRADVVVIGDTENDVDCAHANGFRSIAVDTGFAEPGELLASKPGALFEDLRDTGAVLEAIFD